MFSRRLIGLITCALAASFCGDSKPPTGPTTSTPFTIACPAPQALQAASGQSAAIVTFASPVTSGGTAPVSTLCLPGSGTSFPIGSTTVTCSGADSAKQNATCSFTVTVTAPPSAPRISVTKIVAFGDSITEGFPHTIVPTLVDPPPPGSYPETLLSLLRSRYTAQASEITVPDEGLGGELVADGVVRLPGVLNRHNPQVLLLMEGANDLNTFGTQAPAIVVEGLRAMVRQARQRNIQVLIGNLLPERAGGTPARAQHPELVVPTNDGIRSMAAAEGAILVDMYQAFGGVADTVLISSDGLHPTTAGNTRIAETFFSALRARFEVP